MGRYLPVYCDRCGQVSDWGDFGPDDDSPPECTCKPLMLVKIEAVASQDVNHLGSEYRAGWEDACDHIIAALWPVKAVEQ